MKMHIETECLKLIPGDPEILRSALQGNASLARSLQVGVQEDWTAFGKGPLQFALDRLSDNEEEYGWWTWFPVHKADNQLIGSGGFKGKPGPEGTVEIGYEIAPAYRHRGLATEMARGLITHAFADHRVTTIVAHTLAHENASTKVLQKCGFEKTEALLDPEDGMVWKWVLYP